MDEKGHRELDQTPRVEYLRVRNFRALKDLEIQDVTPLSAFIGPNGSGKTTVFEVFEFLNQSFTTSISHAVESRFGMRELRTRNSSGPIEIDLRVSIAEGDALLFQIAFDEQDGKCNVLVERATAVEVDGQPINEVILSVASAEGWTYEGGGNPVPISLRDSGDLAAPLVGRIGSNEWFIDLRRFVVDWCLFDVDANAVRRIPESGPQVRLSRTGDDLVNVLEWLAERHPDRLASIEERLRLQVPSLRSLSPVPTGDGRAMLQLRDAPFERPIPARNASEGTLKLLAYLTILHGVDPPGLIGFEEPEDSLPPQLLLPLAEDLRIAAGRSQVLMSTHSPAILNALRPNEVWILYRDLHGFTNSIRVADVQGVQQAVDVGAALGNLWEEGFLFAGDPTKNSGMPVAGVLG